MDKLRSSDWNPAHYAANARFVAELAQPVLALLAARPGERILDLGCGDGFLMRRLADQGCHMVGVDSSRAMVDAARSAGLDIRLADGQDLDFKSEFDAVFSNAALHWMKNFDQVLDGVWRSLTPGGRFVAEMGGSGNCAHFVAALEEALDRRGIDGRRFNPWCFPSPADFQRLLRKHGFVVETMQTGSRPTKLPGDVIGWLETFAGSFVAALPSEQRADYLQEVANVLAPKLMHAPGVWIADYVRLRFRAHKRGGSDRTDRS